MLWSITFTIVTFVKSLFIYSMLLSEAGLLVALAVCMMPRMLKSRFHLEEGAAQPRFCIPKFSSSAMSNPANFNNTQSAATKPISKATK